MLIEGIGVVAHRPHRYRFFIPNRYEKIIPHSNHGFAARSMQRWQ